MTNIKIVYQTTPEENDIPWENHFSDIIDGRIGESYEQEFDDSQDETEMP